MQTKIKLSNALILIALVTLGFSSCKKDTSLSDNLEEQIQITGSIAVASSANIITLNNTATVSDSVYAMGACPRDKKKTKITEANLPDAVKTYIATNYAGSTFLKAFSITTVTTNAAEGYVVAISFNNKPVALKFANSGVFVKVLELREGKDLLRPGGLHPGGLFDHRDGKQRDSLVLALLPATIKQYFATNYAQDTLKGAWLNKDGSIVVVSKNVKFFASEFKFDGTFIKRAEIPSPRGKEKEIAQTALPASVSTYLSTTYPNYVFKKAFVHEANGVVQGYMVFIDANLTKYGVVFSNSGAFVAAKIIR